MGNVKCGIVSVLIQEREVILIDTLELVLMRTIAATPVARQRCRGVIQLIRAKRGNTAMSQLVAKRSHSSRLEPLIDSLYQLYPLMKGMKELKQNVVKIQRVDGILVHIYRPFFPKILPMA